MESELMREPWSFPREPAQPVGYVATSPLIPGDEEAVAPSGAGASAPLSTWEENFQDLSGWCMANIQARYDFPTGESVMADKQTGTRNDYSNVLTTAEGATRGFTQAIGRKTFSSGGDVSARRPEPATCVVPPQIDHAYLTAGHQQQQQQQQQQQTYYSSNNNNNNNNSINVKNIIGEVDSVKGNGNVWMGLPVKAKQPVIAADNSNAVWQELSDLGITVAGTGLPLYQPPLVDVATKQQPQLLLRQDSQDVLRALETEASKGFDLLSYLCDDDIPSPGDSVSTDSSRITDVNSLPRLPSNSSAHIVVSPKTYEPITPTTPIDPLKIRLQSTADSPFSQESSKHSPMSSASSEVATATRSSYRQLRTIVKIEKPESPPPIERRSSRPRRTRLSSTTSHRSNSSRGKGSKRMHDDESDSDDEVYRETREKNNEASRKSRMNKKAKEVEMSQRAVELEKDNRILKMKVEELEKLVTSMRNALLRSALKREVKPTNMF